MPRVGIRTESPIHTLRTRSALTNESSQSEVQLRENGFAYEFSAVLWFNSEHKHWRIDIERLSEAMTVKYKGRVKIGIPLIAILSLPNTRIDNRRQYLSQ